MCIASLWLDAETLKAGWSLGTRLCSDNLCSWLCSRSLAKSGHVIKPTDRRRLSSGEARRRYGGTGLHTYKESKRMQAIVTNMVEKHAAASLLAMSQYNQNRPASPQSPLLPDQMMSTERAIRLNYEYLHKCVTSGPATPMPPEAWERIIKLLPPALCTSPLTSLLIPQLHREVKTRYEETIMKTTVRMTLVKPAVNGMEPDTPLHTEPEGLDFSTSWRDSYKVAHARLSRDLHITHPVMQAILKLWDRFRHTLLIDLSCVRSQGPVDIEHFRSLMVENSCEKAEEKLMTSWFNHVMALFSGESSLIADLKMSPNQMNRFYECTSTLISNQLSEMLTQTISHYVDLFAPPNVSRLPQFKLQLCLESGQIEFYPSLGDLEATLLSVVHTVAAAMSNVPNIQHWLLGTHPVPPIAIGVDKAVVERSCAQIKQDLARYLKAPLQHMHSYKKYDFLICGEAEQEVSEFLTGSNINSEQEGIEGRGSGHQLTDYKEYYRDVSREISGLDDAVWTDMFLLECRDIKHGLSSLAQQYSTRLVEHLANKHMEENRRICCEYESFCSKAIKEPEDSHEMMDLIAFMETARTELVRELWESVQDSLKRLSYLIDVHSFSPGEMEVNRTMLMWPAQLNPIFEQNEQIIESSKVKGERELREKQGKAVIEIEKCHQKVEEFNEYSDLSLMQQYCKDIIVLQKRLSDQVVQINKEEELFKWEPTSYPQIEAILTSLELYQKLFNTIYKWKKGKKKFMDGSFLELNAEETQAKVEEFGHEMYKLFKTFNAKAKQLVKERGKGGRAKEDTEDSYAPVTMTTSIQKQIKQFKEYLPVVHTLCNPSLRQRHWDRMNEIIGISITPDSGTSLTKMLKYNLEPYLEQFEGISAGASKEHSLKKAMQKMEDGWDPIIFNTTLYRDTGDLLL